MAVPLPRQVRRGPRPERRVIAATLMLGDPAVQIVSGADVMPSSASQDVNPSHRKSLGRPGLEPGTNALKGRCSTD
jgi:hypothetical protein